MAASAPPPTYKEFSQLLPSFLLLFSFYGFFSFSLFSSFLFCPVFYYFVLSYTLYFSQLFSLISLSISLSSSHISLFSSATYFLCFDSVLILSFNSSIPFSPLSLYFSNSLSLFCFSLLLLVPPLRFPVVLFSSLFSSLLVKSPLSFCVLCLSSP